MSEILSVCAPKQPETKEIPTAPALKFSCYAFADHPPPTRESGQQNENIQDRSRGVRMMNGNDINKKEEEDREQENKEGEQGLPNNAVRSGICTRKQQHKALRLTQFKRDSTVVQDNTSSTISRVFFENLKWLNSEEAVAYLRLPSLGALRNLVYRRQIPCTKLGRILRFDREELDRFLMSQTRHRRIAL
ncbi:MAG: helix-turn-helix domain-containing protein [Bdellovibrionota bacterium]